MFLRIETPSWPCHFGGLAVLDGNGGLLDASGRLRIDEIAEQLGSRLARAPQLRRRLLLPGRLAGGPVWVDDDRFDVRRHLAEATVDAPGEDVQLLDEASRRCETLLDRSRPLWELWFFTGLRGGRVGVLLKLHHAVADGLAAVALMGALFDEADAGAGAGATAVPEAARWAPEPAPTRRALVADAFVRRAERLRLVAAAVFHPAEAVRGVREIARVARGAFSRAGAPATSLNRRFGPGRRVRFARVDLATAKDIAHASGGKVNDVVLAIWAGGLRRLLEARGEELAGLELVATVPVSLRAGDPAATAGNQLGAVALRLPVWEADPGRRLELTVARSRAARAVQQPAAVMGLLAALSATPVGRSFAAHQRAANVQATNVMGPPFPVHLLGARVLAVLPIVQPVGNMGPILCAFSYAGELFLVVTADAGSCPDVDVLVAGMEAEWRALSGREPAAELRPRP